MTYDHVASSKSVLTVQCNKKLDCKVIKSENQNKRKSIYNKFYKKMNNNVSDKNRKSIYNKKFYKKMGYCEICQIIIRNFKIHEKSNKHKRNINQLLLNNNYFGEKKYVKRIECSTCDQSIINFKVHEKSKKHQRNLIKCDFKNCREGINGNFKAYCYTNIKLIDPKIFIQNMLSTIESKIRN